ncbi:expressed unknown protein [Seminavis robusta]|uniref:Uncharacterized protein n=1 Tax=Seminavis robusta TaxID=568900 RepID=A0A9N8HYD4_9STRA|nr:expressed unknown protein [Seminavis robusta]|eukprot:Sro2847_g338430.1 n/a (161) ;mRNA; f:1595-2077
MANRMEAPRAQLVSTPSMASRPSSRGVGIVALSPKPMVVAPVTPTSTPPIRVSTTRRGDGISPSPLTSEDQKRYYESSTWRMFDRIQASRPAKQQPMIPPANSLTSILSVRSAMATLPRYPPKHLSRGYHQESFAERYHQETPAVVQSDADDELIFDLEL